MVWFRPISSVVCLISSFFFSHDWLCYVITRQFGQNGKKNMLRAFQWTWKILGICKMMSAIIYTALMVLHYFWFWSQYFHKQFWNKNVIIIELSKLTSRQPLRQIPTGLSSTFSVSTVFTLLTPSYIREYYAENWTRCSPLHCTKCENTRA